jgi:hypothetical protein
MSKKEVISAVEKYIVTALKDDKLDVGNLHRTDLKNEVSEFLDNLKETYASGLEELTEKED